MAKVQKGKKIPLKVTRPRKIKHALANPEDEQEKAS